TPFAWVTYTADLDWSLTASWELLDMLVNPSGSRMISGPSPNPADNGKLVKFLVEIAQPLGGADTAYKIDDVLVSDFATPAFYDATRDKEAKFSFTGAAKSPLKILKGGFMSWLAADAAEWFQTIWFDGDAPQFRSLGKLN